MQWRASYAECITEKDTSLPSNKVVKACLNSICRFQKPPLNFTLYIDWQQNIQVRKHRQWPSWAPQTFFAMTNATDKQLFGASRLSIAVI